MRLKSLHCPECNAQIKYEAGSQIMFCQYCGAQLHVDDEVRKTEHRNYNYNYNYNYDEAKIREADVKLLKLESEERRVQSDNKLTIKLFVGMFAMALICLLISGILSYVEDSKQKHQEAQGLICPGNAGYYIGKDYQTVKAQFETMGFTNIELIHIGDKSWFSDDWQKVDSVTINGKSFSKTDGFNSTDKVIISYH
jgi:hypothetical protein